MISHLPRSFQGKQKNFHRYRYGFDFDRQTSRVLENERPWLVLVRGPWLTDQIMYLIHPGVPKQTERNFWSIHMLIFIMSGIKTLSLHTIFDWIFDSNLWLTYSRSQELHDYFYYTWKDLYFLTVYDMLDISILLIVTKFSLIYSL